jgi:hypothetical protein
MKRKKNEYGKESKKTNAEIMGREMEERTKLRHHERTKERT